MQESRWKVCLAGGYIIESDKSHVLRDTKIEAGVSDVLATADSRTLAVVEKG